MQVYCKTKVPINELSWLNFAFCAILKKVFNFLITKDIIAYFFTKFEKQIKNYNNLGLNDLQSWTHSHLPYFNSKPESNLA